MLRIKMYPAENGDAYLVDNQNRGQRTTLLVDGGYARTFDTYIRDDLADLASAGGQLDLVVATHVDADHIGGLVRFFSINGPSASPAIIPVANVLHNSLRSLSPTPGALPNLSPADEEIIQGIRRAGYAANSVDQEGEISARQGSSFAQLLSRGGYQWNGDSGTNCVRVGHNCQVTPDVSVAIIGPQPEQLAELRDVWVKQLRRLGVSGTLGHSDLLEDVFEFVSSQETPSEPAAEISTKASDHLGVVYVPDTSPVNRSSISFILCGSNRRALFLGDSRAEDVIEGLGGGGGEFPILFDAITVSHHGSLRNTSLGLLGVVDSPNYFISTNGEKHNHPDFAVVRAIVDRPGQFERKLYFNYSTPASRRLKHYKNESAAPFQVFESVRDAVSI